MEIEKHLAPKINFMQKIAFKFCHWCIPSEQNDHFPRIWREGPFKILVFALIFLQGLSLVMVLGMPQTKIFASVSENSLVKLTNEARNENNLLGLNWNDSLYKAAQYKAEDMLDKNYFAHTSPSGVTPWYWFQKAGYKYYFAGENLAMNFTNSQSVSEAWLKSPAHRANVLNSNYSEIGIAVKSGKIDGKETTVVVEFFASPLQSKVISSTISKNTTSKTSSSAQSLTPETPNQKSVFSTMAPAFTVAPSSSLMEAPKILAGSTDKSIQDNNIPPAQKTASLAEWFFYLPNKLVIFYALVFIALLVLTMLNVIVKIDIQNKKALLHSGVSLAIVLSLIVAQHLILSALIPVIL